VFLGLIYLFLFQIMAIIRSDMRASRKTAKTTHETGNCLEILSGEDSLEGARGNIIPLSTTISFGRDPSNSVQIFDSMVSNHHARISLLASGYFIEDLGSKNGTFVNDVMISQPVSLKRGDVIRIGMVSLKFMGDA
jgi:hypothetical protein